jgi:hypothetical protein
MQQPQHTLLRASLALGAILLALSAGAQVTVVQATPAATEPVSSDTNIPAATARKQAAEVAQGGPARWDREDVTAAARLRTVQKEIAAGLQENLGNCRKMAVAERKGCMAEARALYQQEMAGARARVAAGN